MRLSHCQLGVYDSDVAVHGCLCLPPAHVVPLLLSKLPGGPLQNTWPESLCGPVMVGRHSCCTCCQTYHGLWQASCLEATHDAHPQPRGGYLAEDELASGCTAGPTCAEVSPGGMVQKVLTVSSVSMFTVPVSGLVEAGGPAA